MSTLTVAQVKEKVQRVDRQFHVAGHAENVERYVQATAVELGLRLPEAEQIASAAYFHDVGMEAVAPDLAQRAGRLTQGDFEKIKRHPEWGARLVEGQAPLRSAAPLIACHHERWDGRGYPYGLKGEGIPLGARIIAAADTFCAMLEARPHRDAYPLEEAMIGLWTAAGAQLDRRVVQALLAAAEKAGARAEAPGMATAEEIQSEEEKVWKVFARMTEHLAQEFRALLGQEVDQEREKGLNEFLQRHRLPVRMEKGRTRETRKSWRGAVELAEVCRAVLARQLLEMERLLGRDWTERQLLQVMERLDEALLEVYFLYRFHEIFDPLQGIRRAAV